RDSCAARKTIERAACRTWADLYYTAVRQYGGP
ncbi:MAG: Prokaryotic phospholipase, partial [Actinomycetota bacterium]